MESGQHTFLSLPAEIRNACYDLILTLDGVDEHGTVALAERPKSETSDTAHSNRAILETCKQGYSEAADIFYARYTFKLANPDIIFFVLDTHPHRLRNIKRIVVYDPSDCAWSFEFLNYLQPLDNLKVLIIILSGWSMDSYYRVGLYRLAELQKAVMELPALKEVQISIAWSEDMDGRLSTYGQAKLHTLEQQLRSGFNSVLSHKCG